jgi:hypothetical protein
MFSNTIRSWQLLETLSICWIGAKGYSLN